MKTRGRLADLEVTERFPGVMVRTFESEKATVNRYEFAPGATFPRHHHVQEQITMVEEGQIVFATDDGDEVIAAGEWRIVGPDIPHRVTAGDGGARVTAVLVPRRGDTPVTVQE